MIRSRLAYLIVMLLMLGLAGIGYKTDGKATASALELTYQGTHELGDSWSWNVHPFDSEKVITYGDYQYSGFWDDEGILTLARRHLPTDDVQLVSLGHELTLDNAHRNVSLGISADDGRLHLAYDHHASDLNYRKSVAGLVTSPPATITAAHFTEPEMMTGIYEFYATYPRFLHLNDGTLLFTFNTRGEAGQLRGGYKMLNRYDKDVTPTVLLTDSFADDSQWEAKSGSWSVSGGRYVQSAAGCVARSVIPNNSYGDFHMQFDFEIVDDKGSDQNWTGVMFRQSLPSHNWSDSGYLLHVRSNGNIVLRDGSGVIKSYVLGEAQTGTHTIKLQAKGPHIQVYYDGKRVISAYDDSYGSAGSISLATCNTETAFDHVLINDGEGPWQRVGAIFSNSEGVYNAPGDSCHLSTERVAYMNHVVVDANDRIHISWTYREDPGPEGNQGLYYVYSDDQGVSWYNDAGLLVADLSLGQSVTVTSPGIEVFDFPCGSWLVNGGSMAVDSDGNPHIVNQMSAVVTSDPSAANNHHRHFWRDSNGQWHDQWITDTQTVHTPLRGRGTLLIDSNDDLHFYTRDGTSLKYWRATQNSGWNGWLENTLPVTLKTQIGEGLLYDKVRWQLDGILDIGAIFPNGKYGILELTLEPIVP